MKKLLIAGCIFAIIPIIGFIMSIIIDFTVEEKDWVFAEQYASGVGRYSVDVYTVPDENDKTLTEVKVFAMDHMGFKSKVIKNEAYEKPEFSFEDSFLDGYSILIIKHNEDVEKIKIIWGEVFSEPQ